MFANPDYNNISIDNLKKRNISNIYDSIMSVGIWDGSDWTWKAIKILSRAFDFFVHARMKSLSNAYFYKIDGRCKADEDVKIDGRCKADEDEWDESLIKLK